MHDHNHAHQQSGSARIGLAFALNFGFTIIEFVGGIMTNSTAIMADAVHDLGDSLALGGAWFLERMGRREASAQFTYGLRRLSLLSAVFSAVVLIIGSVWVLQAAIPRLVDPVMPHTEGMIGLAILGVVVNGLAAYRLSAGRTMNERVLNWHLLEDVLGWLGVLVVALVLQVKPWPILDPLLSIAFTLYIGYSVVKNLMATVRLFLQGVPGELSQFAVRDALLEIEDVAEVHHLHIWSLDGEHHVLTAHVVVYAAISAERNRVIKQNIADVLVRNGMSHTTVEIEWNNEPCRDQSTTRIN
ncbi:cation diffusion facilitator family transporter [Gilvimarinus sp. SDUM040013]|uniref:Cation diffusion facilitator family transporter n=1 Tax=Gilvimarinus gilvus TaxID=3058038 RepID=A0ABU4RZV2_9GAMM|nr:cation diffusion facilitator family transporter [Gilvimarinus sp. SDUM040013]MDO3386552.1 cation diffusion facilitator family transporter [Gilvimarinus sp. SDUM040013]MDX6849128.1 cation diffusion facilitator family transporter [Gilvimarinus sp. SDUM040013]